MTRAAPRSAPAHPAGGFAEAPAGFHHDQAAADADAPAPALPALDAELMASEAIRRLLACDPSHRAPFIRDPEVFRRRHHAYLAARAALDDPDAIDDDAAAQRRDAAFDLAEALLMATPAAHPYQIWAKVALLEATIQDAQIYGKASAPRLLLAMGSLKHDLIHHKVGDGRLLIVPD